VKNPFRSRPTLGWILLLVPVLAVFYWKTLITGQFSLLTDSEGVNQAYAWLHFWLDSIRHGSLPIWDPYTMAGHSFSGEMQTGAFNPLRLIWLLAPFNRRGLLSPAAYHVWYALMHFMAAGFMFALLREFRLSRFSSFMGGLCFSLGGFVGHMYWPDMYESAAWLPIVFLFLLRALRAETVRKTALNAAFGGLAVGMTILASRLHIVMMEMIVVFSGVVYHACASPGRDSAGRAVSPADSDLGAGASAQGEPLAPPTRPFIWRRAVIAFAIVAALGAASGAVQLFPSLEYSPTAYRLLGEPGFLPGDTRIPYSAMQDYLMPNAIAYLVIPFGYTGNASMGEAANPYIGFLPLIAAIIGIRRYWGNLWVRYLAGLAVASFLYCLGQFSPLAGALYAVVPKMWMLREASRMAYLLDFALAALAAFGIEALISAGKEKALWPGLDRILTWGLAACGVALFIPAVWSTKPEIGINPWISLSIVIIFLSYGLLRYMESGHRGRGARLLLAGLVLFDLNAFDWGAVNRSDAERQGSDQLRRAESARGAMAFLKSRPGPFRIKVQADEPPNVGDLFRVPMIDAAHPGSLSIAYMRVWTYSDLMNVRYILTPASKPEPGAVYQDKNWKVYENPTGLPRAWVAHETRVEPSDVRASDVAGSAGFDARKIAVVSRPVDLAPLPDGAVERVVFSAVEPNRLAMDVQAASRGMLVISEMYYPGWRAKVNGRAAEIHKVDGALRGVVTPAGRSKVELDYAPASIYAGGALSFVVFLGVGLAAFLERRRRS
jgi:hypothetical protein